MKNATLRALHAAMMEKYKTCLLTILTRVWTALPAEAFCRREIDRPSARSSTRQSKQSGRIHLVRATVASARKLRERERELLT